MNQLTTQKTMSSLEIVDMINERRRFNATIDKPYIELRHDNFFSKVTSVIGSDNAPKFLGTQSYGNNNTRLVYNFPKREACLMAMSYSYELQALVFDRMTELESQSLKPQLPDFTNPAIAARAWADEVEAKQIAQEQLQLAVPKVQYFDMVADVNNYMNATTVGQKFGMSATVLNKHLEELNVYNRTIKQGRVFQQWFIDKGLGVMKKTDNGYNQSRFTNKGEQWVVEKFVSEGIV